MIHHVTKVTRHLVFYSLIALGIGSIVVRGFALGVDAYKADLEYKIRELTSLPLEIGGLSANLRGINPEVILKNIRVLSTENNAESAIELKEIRVGIDMINLIYSRQLLSASWLTLVGVKLTIVRKQDGSIAIVGLNSNDSEPPYWLLDGRQYEVLKSEITWLDEQNKHAPVHFDQVNMLIKNDSDENTHELHLLSQLPENYGDELRVSLSIQGDIVESDMLSGEVYVAGNSIQVAKILNDQGKGDFGIESGNGDFKLWSQWENSSLVELSGQVNAKDLTLKSMTNKTGEILQLNALETLFSVKLLETGWAVKLSDFNLTTKNHAWPQAELSVASNDDFSQLTGAISDVDLKEVSELVQFFVPLEEKQQSILSKLDIKGALKDFTFFVDRKNQHFAVNGEFNNIFSEAYLSFPKVENITGSIKGSHQSGGIAFNTTAGGLFYSDLFRNKFVIDHFQGLLEWQQTTDKWQLFSNSLIINSKDIETETQIKLAIPKDNLPIFMDMQIDIANVHDVSKLSEYYPASEMGKDTLNWLDNAFVAGEIKQGKALVYGELQDMPYLDGQGVFEVLLETKDLELQFDSEWPHLKKLASVILFYKAGMTIDLTHADANGMTIESAVVEIGDFNKSNQVVIHGQLKGRIIDGLRYMQKSPAQEIINDVLAAITPKGLTQVELNLKIPLVDDAPQKIDVLAHLNKASLNVSSIDLDVKEISGELRYTDAGLYSDNLKANTLGYPVNANIKNAKTSTIISIDGKIDVLNLKKQFSFLDKEFVTQRIQGVARYEVKLDLPDQANRSAQLGLNSNLKGIIVDLPGQLKKTKNQEKQLSLDMSLDNTELLPLAVNYDDQLKAAININTKQQKMDSAQIVYGEGRVSFPKAKGINIKIQQSPFDLSQWMGLIKNAASNEEQAEISVNGISLTSRDLLWKNKSYGEIELAMQRIAKQWQGNISSDVAKGAFIIPFDRTDADKIKLNMEFLKLSALMNMNIQDVAYTTDDVPLIDVHSVQLWWKETNLGRLEIETELINNGVRFKEIDVISQDHNIEMSADWIKNDSSGMTKMSGSFIADDLGVFLSNLGINTDLEETQSNIIYAASWAGSPYQFSIKKMDAEVNMSLEEGRISSIEPGFGRILGVLAMEQWIKRLTLDFEDLYKAGLSFNSITGHFKISKGKAITNDLLVDAVPAKIAIKGGSDLLIQSLNHWVEVNPKSSGALPIAGTIVGNIAGTITSVFIKDYKEGYFFGSKYKITGSWDNILVTPLSDQNGVINKTWDGLTDFSWMKLEE